MNTTKTLEAVKLEAKEQFEQDFDWISGRVSNLAYKEMLSLLEKSVEIAYLSALDACRENVKDMSVVNITFNGTETINSYIHKEGVLSAIDSLRTGGKETI